MAQIVLVIVVLEEIWWMVALCLACRERQIMLRGIRHALFLGGPDYAEKLLDRYRRVGLFRHGFQWFMWRDPRELYDAQLWALHDSASASKLGC